LLAERGEYCSSSSSAKEGGNKLSTVSEREGGCGAGEAMEGGNTLFIMELSWRRTVRKDVEEPDEEPVEECGAGALLGSRLG
jgi:hypothetical protein